MPTDAFEINYVFTDGEGATDNNQGKNYMTPVQGGMTSELWEEKAVERLVSSPPYQVPDAHPTDVLHDTRTMLVYSSSCMQNSKLGGRALHYAFGRGCHIALS